MGIPGYVCFVFFVLAPEDWALIRSNGSLWLGRTLGVTLAALIAVLGLEYGRLKGIPNWAVVAVVPWGLAMLVAPFGTSVFLAILCGRVGFALAGRVGLVGGELLGASLGASFGCAIAFLAVLQLGKRVVGAKKREDRLGGESHEATRSQEGGVSLATALTELRYWSVPLLQLGMTIASILWIIFADHER